MNDPHSELHKAARIKQILDDPIVIEAKEHIEAELWRTFKDVKPTDIEALKEIKAMQYYHVKYFAYFSRVLTDGKIATLEIERQKKSVKDRLFG